MVRLPERGELSPGFVQGSAHSLIVRQRENEVRITCVGDRE
jgi:hypothetical protein